MAWRDSRGSRKRLLLAVLAIALGIAALVAIASFRANVQEAVQQQAKSLLGADLAISSRQPFSSEAETLIDSIAGEQTRETSFSSMAYFPKSDGARLVQVRALAGSFPYYGVLETVPPEAARTFRTGVNALVDDNLLLQLNSQIGDAVKIGDATFHIVGRLKKIPGESAAAALIGPRVYISHSSLEQTGLLQKGSRINYKVYFQLAPTIHPEQLLETIQPQLNRLRLDSDTVAKRAARVGKVMENLSRFLNLVGFIALLLGGVGVASAMHVYVKEKLYSVALLHCVGVQPKRTFAIYLMQGVGMGLVGGILGAVFGIGVQTVFPWLLRDFLPVKIVVAIAWSAVLQGLIISLLITFLFALLPLLSIRRVSPLLAFRAVYESDSSHQSRRDPLRLLVVLLIILCICGFAFAHTERWTYGVGFCVALAGAFALLAGVAKFLVVFTRAYFPDSWPYVWRQGLANLSRPHNQTLILILTLGAGTFFLLTLYLTQHMLLQQVARLGESNQPNLVLFDIQSDQREGVGELVRSFSLPVLQDVPLVTMRLSTVKGKDVVDLRGEKEEKIPDWALQWEYRATYRDHLIDTETLIAGSWQGKVASLPAAIPISLEDEIARTLGVTIGDKLAFDVQGIPLTTVVSSIRKVDWQRVQPNFFVVFPAGVLEQAPQTYVLISQTSSTEQSAAVQRAVIQQFPNVSAIDLTVILHTLDAILGRIAFAIRFMAFFSMAAGFIVLVSAVLTSRTQRLKESALLRTLGASRWQIRAILTTEYLFLGSFAAIAGLVLALLGSWGLAYFFLDVSFVPTGLPLLVSLVVTIGLTVLTGMFGSRGIINQSPLAVLRSES